MTVWHKLASMSDAERAALPGFIRDSLRVIERWLNNYFEGQDNE